VILLLLFYFIKRNKLEKTKQLLLKSKQAVEIKNKEEVLELKNKELLSSAMQVIERDGMLEDIKKQLKALEFNKENSPYIKRIIQSLKINRSQKWEEFDLHFTSLNHNYFTSLKNKFPALTKTDLKICAFINLGFSSKDMAQIMGIGADSVNTTRSRLRKRMGLSREIVLVDFLQEFNKEIF
ncbi:MAG: tetratricopeptide repeat protein, partial [Flavicella sp.]|nr:tetratricopeptide repeat protein [Flavicella sp.]